MKNLSDFKKRLKVGVKLHTVNHDIRFGKDLGIREISIVQSNSFALKTIRDDKFTDSWCSYPKASEFKVLDKDTVQISWISEGKLIPILTYKFVD